MIEKIKNYFKVWWIPIVSYFITIGIFILGCALQRDWIINVFITLFLINFLGTFISSIVQIFNKKWYYSIPQITLSIFIFNYFSTIFMYSPPDYYGVHKKIPSNIEIYKPLEYEPKAQDFAESNLLITSCSQPGIYCYYSDFTPNQLGYFYIKAYEITSNDKLSEKRIKERSKTKLKNLKKKIHTGEFTIYEGTWGYKYAGRIELWYKPDNNNDYKVTERNYIVEGWMR